MLGNWKSSPVIKKFERPVLTPSDIPHKATLVFNAGVTKFNGKYVMAFRNDYGDYDHEKHLWTLRASTWASRQVMTEYTGHPKKRPGLSFATERYFAAMIPALPLLTEYAISVLPLTQYTDFAAA
jgi:hypothetical protein